MDNIKILKGNIIHTPKFGEFDIREDAYIIVRDEYVEGVYDKLPGKYNEMDIIDYGEKLIIPGFVDLHLHASQFANRGLGVDKELLDWLNVYTFPEEAKFENVDFARKAYEKFAYELWLQGTTRSVIFATIHKESTMILMDILDEIGLGAFVGKLNMDRNSPDFYIEDTKKSLEDTEEYLKITKDKYKLVKPIITPRFVPSCTSELMEGLGKLAKKYDVPIQSHLSENRSEIEWVRELHPDCSSYASVYDKYGLFGGDHPTVMAHCVWNTDEEIELMFKNNIFIAHSPCSNANVSSGIAPIRKYINRGIPVGLASDISGGHRSSIPDAMVLAAQLSNLRWVHIDEEEKPLSIAELFYLATKGGGEFFGKVGSFEKGFEFDALIIDDSNLADVNLRSLEERIQKYIYLGDERNIVDRYVAGEKLKVLQ